MLYENGEFERIRPHLTPLECGIIFDSIPEGAISRKVGLIWGSRLIRLNPREHTVLWSSDTVELEVQSIATHPSDPGVLAIRTTDGLLITSDAGASWIPLHQAGYQIENVSYPRLPEGVNGPVVTTGSPWTICIGSVNGVWCHRGG